MNNHDDDEVFNRHQYQERHFITLCHCLRNNDPNITVVPAGGDEPETNRFGDSPVGYGRRLGQALQRNTKVTVLRIDATTFLDPTIVQTSQIQQDAELFLQYIRNSTSVRSFHVFICDNPNQHNNLYLLGLIFNSLCDSSCIEELYLTTNGCLPPLDTFTKLMKSTKTIRTMTLALSNQPGNIRNPNASQMIGTALQFNCNLQKLTLILSDNFGTGEYTATVVSSLAALGSLPFLHELFLNFYIPLPAQNLNVFEALESFLQSTLSLHHLCLYNCHGLQDPEQMECLVRGLRDNETIHKLTWSCNSTQTAAQRFIEFMQSPHANNILELNLGFASVQREFEGVSYGALVRQILSTGTSRLQIIRFHDIPCGLGDVFNLIRTSHVPNHLRTVEIHHLDGAEWIQLFKCIPKMLHIQELILPHFDRDYQASQLVEALRRNGTIQSLSFWPESHRSRYGFNDVDERRVRAYIQRNVVIPTLLSGSVELLPTLFFATRPCWKTWPNTVVHALKIAIAFVGPTDGAQRMSR